MLVRRIDLSNFVRQFQKYGEPEPDVKQVREIQGGDLHPWLAGAIFRLWQVPGHPQVWLNQHPRYTRPDHSEVMDLTGFEADSALEMGAFLGITAERLSRGEEVRLP